VCASARRSRRSSRSRGARASPTQAGVLASRAHRLISDDGGGEQHEAQSASHGSCSIRRAIVDPASRAAGRWADMSAAVVRAAAAGRVSQARVAARAWVMRAIPVSASRAQRPIVLTPSCARAGSSRRTTRTAVGLGRWRARWDGRGGGALAPLALMEWLGTVPIPGRPLAPPLGPAGAPPQRPILAPRRPPAAEWNGMRVRWTSGDAARAPRQQDVDQEGAAGRRAWAAHLRTDTPLSIVTRRCGLRAKMKALVAGRAGRGRRSAQPSASAPRKELL
jgi:hypothetical protein